MKHFTGFTTICTNIYGPSKYLDYIYREDDVDIGCYSWINSISTHFIIYKSCSDSYGLTSVMVDCGEDNTEYEGEMLQNVTIPSNYYSDVPNTNRQIDSKISCNSKEAICGINYKLMEKSETADGCPAGK